MSTGQLAVRKLARAISKTAQTARSEEDLRIGIEHALRDSLLELELEPAPEYEKTTLSGSADAVYGNVIIEYKRPGRLAEVGYATKLAEQIARYLTDLARDQGKSPDLSESLEKKIGVGLDGRQILFVRYSASRRGRGSPLPSMAGNKASYIESGELPGFFEIVGPVPLEREGVELLLLYLRSLSRKPLTPEALGAAFGPNGEIAPKLVNLFYSALQGNRDHPRVSTLFGEWDRIFGIVYGNELSKAQRDAPELAALYDAVPEADLKPLFFSVHTYYALLMKFIAIELASLQSGALVGSSIATLPALSEERLRNELEGLESGGTFALLGINNFLEGDFFGWYLDTWNDSLADGVRALAQTLGTFEPATSTLEPERTRDLLKKLYQHLVPRKLRHDLGEYYTPDWLANRLLNQLGYGGDPRHRIIDPGCGSGTFLVLALRRLRQYAIDNLVSPSKVLESALTNIVGFDLNPLSVIAARTNYLLAMGDLLRYRTTSIDLPIYMCDSILTPTERADIFGKSYRLSAVSAQFDIPGETIAAGEMAILSSLLESCIRDQYSPEEFLERARQELQVTEPATETVLEGLYRKLYRLEEEGRDGLWARLIKNAFAPVLVGTFDFVAGNPPWVNWENLSDDYREATKRLWSHYGLFSLKGHAARLGGGKKDLSMLFAYAASDHYLKQGGTLGFIMTQTVFKTKGAGDGFRRFRFGEDGEHMQVVHVDDLSRLQPFEGATNRTSVMIVRRNERTRYPVPYTAWFKGSGKVRVDIDKPLHEVLAETQRSHLWAQPVAANKPTSPWITARKATLSALEKVISPSDYRAYSGACTWFNGIYWVKILDELPDGRLLIENLGRIGRAKARSIEGAVEPDV